jgi:3-deoxy-D-manno-octulosonic-acid transferase
MQIYQILIRLLSPILWLVIAREAIKSKGNLPFFFQKVGLHFPNLNHSTKPIWIHCASIGEVKAAEPLIKALKANHTLLITTNTATSKPLVTELFGQNVTHCYLPFDWPFALNRFIKKYQPTRLWVMETEIWPNLFRVASKNRIELCILNGRLTQKTFSSPKWLQAAYKSSLQQVDKVITRTNQDAELFIKLGANPDKVIVLGNLKYSAQPEAQQQIRPIQRDFLLAASTHADEELHITQVWLELKRPELLVIVPRHPKRSTSIQKQLKFLGTSLLIASKGQQPNETTKVFLDDRIGKLLPLYAYAKLVIMGGSFVPKGGHNILEPAAFKKAILTGLDSRDFEDEMQILKGNQGILQVEDYKQLKAKIKELLEHPDKAETFGENAFTAIQKQRNTLKNYLKALKIQ